MKNNFLENSEEKFANREGINRGKENITDLFDKYITKVDITFDYIMSKMVNNWFDEKEILNLIMDVLNDYYRVLKIYDNSDEDIRQKYYEILNDKTKTFYTIIRAYNELANSSMSILRRPIELSNEDNKIDLNDTVIALANGKLDLYKKIHYRHLVPIYGNYNNSSYNEGDIYVGIINEDVAIKKSHVVISSVDVWAQKGVAIMHNNHMYYVTVNRIQPIVSYGILRDEMYKNRMQIIPFSEEGKANKNEILDVIDYGMSKYRLKEEKQKKYN